LSSTTLQFVDETGSTNADLARELRAGSGRAEGQWRIARRQVAGKGRQGREWFDGSGNFMGSTSVQLRPDDPPPASLSFVAALAVYEAVDETLAGVAHPSLKWPNDVLLNGAKLCGILLEMVKGHVIVGIGVNLAKAPQLPERPTAALANHGPAPDLEWFANKLAGRFAERLATWRQVGLSQTLSEFQLCSIHSSGSAVRVHDQDGSTIEGAFAGLEPSDGALRLRLADGSEHVIRAGDIV
jgi:BirA family biotin operon repressor/biotin-[acetyl-CoA-carboxylase] ligase